MLHTNPQAFAPVRAKLGDLDNVELIQPQPYRAFVRLLADADVILTDSGGIQEEAPYLGKPVIVTREVTERPEASQAGAASIIGTDRPRSWPRSTHVLDDELLRETMSRRIDALRRRPRVGAHRPRHRPASGPGRARRRRAGPAAWPMSDPEAAEAAGVEPRSFASTEVAS